MAQIAFRPHALLSMAPQFLEVSVSLKHSENSFGNSSAGGENSSLNWNRREFVSISSGLVAAASLPVVADVRNSVTSSPWYWLSPEGQLTEIDEPARWAIANRNTELLAQARERLLQCDPQCDWRRIFRVTLRRCYSHLRAFVRTPCENIWEVYYWKDPDSLKPVLHRVLRDRQLFNADLQLRLHRVKKGIVQAAVGSDFRIGWSLGSKFPLSLWLAKIENRHRVEADDDTYAPSSELHWFYAERMIQWASLKAIWRDYPTYCPDCLGEQRTFLRRGGSILATGGFFLHICPRCKHQHAEWHITPYVIQTAAKAFIEGNCSRPAFYKIASS